jgi:hypothetical protein
MSFFSWPLCFLVLLRFTDPDYLLGIFKLDLLAYALNQNFLDHVRHLCSDYQTTHLWEFVFTYITAYSYVGFKKLTRAYVVIV